VPITLLLIISLGYAQSPPAESLSTDQTIAQAVVKYSPPPANFNPLSASDADLESYGFPPRPNARHNPEASAHWKRAVSIPRVANPVLRQTRIYNGPAQQLLLNTKIHNGTATNQTQMTSINWSGYAITTPMSTFTNNGSWVLQEWVVPIAQQAFGVCNGFSDYSSQWSGFDGANPTDDDVLQAGTEADAFCPPFQTLYSAWIEWAPNPEVRVSVPTVEPGNLMFSEVWYTNTPPFGHAYLANITLQQSAAYAFNPPSGVIFNGDSVEWILERPTIKGRLTDLTNYVADQYNTEEAYDTANLYTPSSSPHDTTTLAITMTCPPWTPDGSCPSTLGFSLPMSTPTLYDPWAVWFNATYPVL
jgi:hypothetical protein